MWVMSKNVKTGINLFKSIELYIHCLETMSIIIKRNKINNLSTKSFYLIASSHRSHISSEES